MSKNITIYDIAKKFAVSPSTVSRALNDHKSISEKTKKAIKAYAEKHGYKINTLAASLRSQKSRTLGIIVSWINRPFISSMISGVEAYANERGYNVIISQTKDNYEKEVENASALFNSRVDGLIVSLAAESINYDHFNQFIDNDIPVVFVDRVPEEIQADKVVINNFESAFMATEHLIELGCKKIAHIGGSQARFIYRERKDGFVAALRKHGINVNEDWIRFSQSVSSEDAFGISESILSQENKPDGFFCANDSSAISVIQSARKRGINVPDQLKIVGFNNDPVSTIITPKLTTINHPGERMGEIAAEHILNKEEHPEPEIVKLDTELIIRESTVINAEVVTA